MPSSQASDTVDRGVGGRPVRTVLLASPRSRCAGVEQATEIAERSLFVHGEIVATIPESQIVDRLFEEALRLTDQEHGSSELRTYDSARKGR
jgi:4-hydroxy-3-methylbut-2-enyl diphosphate reductase IspH